MSRRKPTLPRVPPEAVQHPMSADMLAAVAERFRALGEPARLRLLEFLCQRPLSVTELSEATGQSHANTSKHLSVLLESGFVARRRDGNRVVYSVTDQTPQQLCGVICHHVVRAAEDELRRVRG